MASRRKFLKSLAASGVLYKINPAGELLTNDPSPSKDHHIAGIDRAALVTRHNPVLQKLDPLSPLSVGNGEFAFTCDTTGLQTFPKEYENAMPLCTMSQWGWHTTPQPDSLKSKTLRLVQYDTYGREVGYQTSSEGQSELYNWLRENPHRLYLGQIGLRLLTGNGREAQPADLTDIKQMLNLWTGIITSSFRFEGKQAIVKTAAHPRLDILAVSIESDFDYEGRVALRVAFPYGSPAMQAADWGKLERHQTEITGKSSNRADIRRRLDDDEYNVAVAWDTRAEFSNEKAHTFLLTPKIKSRLDFVIAFSPNTLSKSLPNAKESFAASAEHWKRFWSTGGAIDLSGSKDSRAVELERRIILSQYLTAIQCSGSRPPQETGLTVNSWYGKFHLEMHWWHAAHFPLWNRLPLLEKSLDWYNTILQGARERAKQQGYTGARWPKMVGPDGRDSPSPIGPLLIWQQPHPIFYAELCYQSNKNRKTLERYKQIVFESAEFMASFAHFDREKQKYVLGPPVIPAQENHPPRETWNPTFELVYWSYGLKTAQSWRERLGMKRNHFWDRVISNLSPLPVKDGVYLAHENCPQTFTERNRDHPSMLAALGVLSGEGVDAETMRRTLKRAMKEWRWEDTWGWDYPMTAMTAARLNEPEIAIDALLMNTQKNRYLTNGHNWQRTNLPCYLPGNGGLLYAVAMMAAGWKGARQTHAPGFPANGSWNVRWENLNDALLRQL